MFDFASLNWLAILVVTVAGFLIGGVYYGPLFGKAWLAALGKSPEDLDPSAKPFILSFLTGFVTAVAIALLVGALGLDSIGDGLALGALVGVGCITTAMASDYAFCGFADRLLAIQAGYRIAYSLVMGGVLAVWH